MLSPRQRQGQGWEGYASRWLQQEGLKLLITNFRCKAGEIDLIMQDNDCLVFVEVRYRADRDRGGPLASVTPAKQQKLARAARYFLRQNPQWRHAPVRFDVLGICGNSCVPEVAWQRRAILPADSQDGWA